MRVKDHNISQITEAQKSELIEFVFGEDTRQTLMARAVHEQMGYALWYAWGRNDEGLALRTGAEEFKYEYGFALWQFKQEKTYHLACIPDMFNEWQNRS
jgi:hypothetical protein